MQEGDKSKNMMEEIMLASGKVNGGKPPPQTIPGLDENLLEAQRSGMGTLSYLLFPLIAVAAIVFSAFTVH